MVSLIDKDLKKKFFFLIATHYPGLYDIAYTGSPLFQKWREHGA